MITIQNPNQQELPIGSIVLWYGLAADIPSGWQQCNGANGSLDIENAFVKGTIYTVNVGNTGGALVHSHGIQNSGTAGNHTHTYSLSTSTNTESTTANDGTILRAKVSHGHSASGNTQSGGSHSHSITDTNDASSLPSYHRLYYIQRIA